MESSIIQFEVPSDFDLDRLSLVANYTDLLNTIQRQLMDANILRSDDNNNSTQNFSNNKLTDYDVLTATVWVIIIIAMLLVTSVFCICACLFYNKIKMWKHNGE